MAKAALKAIQNAKWFCDISPAFQDDLAKLASPMHAPDGHVFVKEGSLIDSFIVVESGLLVRTKAPAAGGEPVLIDKIGPGGTSGFLHVVGAKENESAFATIAAAQDSAGRGGLRAWVVDGAAFRELCAGNVGYSAEVVKILALALRSATKIVRASVSHHDDGGDADDTSPGAGKTLKVLCYDTASWVKENFEPQISAFNEGGKGLRIKMDFTQDRLDARTAKFAAGYDAVCLFVNDTADREALVVLYMGGVKMVAMRCAGFDRVDLKALEAFGMSIARVPAYSPYAVAEHAISLLMSLNRKITASSARVKMANFTLDSSLLGMDIHEKTVGVMGTGKIGQILCRIVKGFGANLLAYDVFESQEVKDMGGTYTTQDDIYKNCDVIFLMMPLLPATKHTINKQVIAKLKRGVFLINTSRGGLIETEALVEGLQSGVIGGCGLDVYENEGEYFFQDWSANAIKDNTLVTLLGSNRVVMTPHQAFFTREAIHKIVSTTLDNLHNFGSGLRGKDLPNGCG